MKKLLILFAVTFAFVTASAQNVVISEIARIESPVLKKDFPKDLNGNDCVLVVVDVDKENVVFEGNIIGTPKYSDGSYFVFLTQGSKFLNVKCPGANPMLLRFSEYGIDEMPPLTAVNVVLDSGNGQTTVSDVTLSPEDAAMFQEAVDLFTAMDLVHAYPLLLKADSIGEPSAGYYLGYIYSDPFAGVRKSAWMVPKALKSTVPESPVKRDLKKSYEYYLKSAEKGYLTAQFAVGECLEKGTGVKKDKKAAMEWYRKAAERGHLQAQEKLGYKVKKHKVFGITVGYGTSDDEFFATDMSSDATDLTAASSGRRDKSGNACAVIKVVMPFDGVKFDGDMVGEPEFRTSEYWVFVPSGAKELTVNYKDFSPLKVNFSSLGQSNIEPKTTYRLVVSYPADLVADFDKLTAEDCLRIGMGYVERRDNQYYRWMNLAAEKGNLSAKAMVGNAYLIGSSGVKKDVKKGIAMLTEASDAGSGEASYFLARYYDLFAHKGKEAQKWYDKAASQGYKAAEGKKASSKNLFKSILSF